MSEPILIKQQSIRREENFVGKMKGKLNLQKQIKHNITSGPVDRNYCIFNQLRIDNKENHILKYTFCLQVQTKTAYPNLRGGVCVLSTWLIPCEARGLQFV